MVLSKWLSREAPKDTPPIPGPPGGPPNQQDDPPSYTEAVANPDSNGGDPAVTIHPFPSMDGMLVKVQPPQNPPRLKGSHVPCDIVLVIDVSGSMQLPAPIPKDEAKGQHTEEDIGLSVLDLVKHAARTIMATLDENDRLSIVTFSNDAKVVKSLTSMTKASKAEFGTKISLLQPLSATNLWAGIREGIKVVGQDSPSGRVQSLLVLTDGEPNHQCPAQGYFHKIKSKGFLRPSIHTFGFGYGIKSGLLKAIAEAGHGNYSFIPDAGDIGNVFIHAVAHLQSTFATKCVLNVQAPEDMLIKSLLPDTIDKQSHGRSLAFDLTNLQYGQSRDICLAFVDEAGQHTAFTAGEKTKPVQTSLRFSKMLKPEYNVVNKHYLHQLAGLPPSVIAYHQSRWMICNFLASFYKLSTNSEYKHDDVMNVEQRQQELQSLLDTIPAAKFPEDKLNISLMEDIKGQIKQAVSKQEYWERWGRHYFVSLWDAHAKQLCNTFRDPGPQMYNANSKLFQDCKAALDNAFDELPAPQPSNSVPHDIVVMLAPGSVPQWAGGSSSLAAQPFSGREVKMSSFNSRSSTCFAAYSQVQLADGSTVPICKLQAGASVQTLTGPRDVRAVLMTIVKNFTMMRKGNLTVTPWHPIRIDAPVSRKCRKVPNPAKSEWIFPAYIRTIRKNYTGPIYSILLEPADNPDSHTILIGDIWATTLGHGLVTGFGHDIRAHPFWGNYDAVYAAMLNLRHGKQDGVYLTNGTKRDEKTGEVCGFNRWNGDVPNGQLQTQWDIPGLRANVSRQRQSNSGSVRRRAPRHQSNSHMAHLLRDYTERKNELGGF
ncbi:hint-domain-containing protein [Xylariaceae sp. FL0255]|nr:hint-domain-containing protein [Xylariaceae sp. FL0255]